MNPDMHWIQPAGQGSTSPGRQYHSRRLAFCLQTGSFAISPVDVDVLAPANSVTPFLSLGIHHWVQIIVVKHHRIGLHEIDACGAAVGGKDGTEDAPVSVEGLHQLLGLQEEKQKLSSGTSY